ncbi:MAG: hypothetical protein QM589_04130 [Thermomicrobiales bacterium]
MIAVILLIVFGGLFAAMAVAPVAIEEIERAEERRQAVRSAPVSLPSRPVMVNERGPVAA